MGSGQRGLFAAARQELPGVYPALTIPAHPVGMADTSVSRPDRQAMRIYGSNAAQQAGSSAGPRRTASAAFSLSQTETPKAPTQTAALRTIGGIDALLALQGADDPTERRRRAVRRGGIALDALDELKVSLLSGSLSPSMLMRLKSAATELGDSSGDPRLDALMAEIELRLAVEIAKMTPR